MSANNWHIFSIYSNLGSDNNLIYLYWQSSIYPDLNKAVSANSAVRAHPLTEPIQRRRHRSL